MQIVLSRQHKKDKRFGPGPSNNYTSGTAKGKFWQRKPKVATEKEAELGTAGGLAAVQPQHDMRPSHDTAYTGSTVAAPNSGFAKKEVEPLDSTTAANTNANSMYANMEHEPHGDHAPHVGWEPHNHGNTRGDYYTAPQTAPNPYGYDAATTTTGTAKNF